MLFNGLSEQERMDVRNIYMERCKTAPSQEPSSYNIHNKHSEVTYDNTFKNTNYKLLRDISYKHMNFEDSVLWIIQKTVFASNCDWNLDNDTPLLFNALSELERMNVRDIYMEKIKTMPPQEEPINYDVILVDREKILK